jgi:replication factor C subunit 2/4
MISFRSLLDLEPSTKKQEKVNIIPITDVKQRQPWVEKYRPKELNQVIYQDEVISMLKDTLVSGNLPHTLFYGPPGVGKTSVAQALGRALFGPNQSKERILELNASDERGINIVRNKIITFAKTAIGSKDKNYPSPPYKYIILDEADAMTNEAQSALRKTMEDYSNITRFCFICNYVNQIIDPIKSRCVKFRFKPLEESLLIKKLAYIAKEEKINILHEELKLLADISEGDMRKAIMNLQNIKYLTYNNSSKIISKEDIFELTNSMPKQELLKIQQVCLTKNKNKSNIKTFTDIAQNIVKSGYPIHDVIKHILKFIINNNLLTDNMKSIISLHFATMESRLLDGADEYIQILHALLCIHNTYNI